MRPQEDLYWNAVESDSEESLKDYHAIPPAKQPYIDPWDLENYAYIREHLDSMELSSNQSVPLEGSSGSGGEFGEANSHSFFYVPGTKRLSEKERNSRILDIPGDYADIDEVQYISRNMSDKRRHYYDLEENPYEDALRDNSVFGIYDQAGRFRRVTVPISVNAKYKSQLDRNLSSSTGDYTDEDPYSKHDIYSKLDEMTQHTDQTMPIYDDVRRIRRKPKNFGLTNYGHLKIDYSISWNDLNKYIRYNS
ncbi:hypothetical protein GWI33_005664 [Rhynchophorus ferrugineus]|uniref:Uncharacterized protein n=1 Tax=Rhynchophorus ferrugineus TaxID=354439 RepID=A0A834IWL6_RHYFE|nr:hypothetical protein GWI33_005664 [Rhynchophorus ferrugineus]